MMNGVPLGVPTPRRVIGLSLIWNRFDSSKSKSKSNPMYEVLILLRSPKFLNYTYMCNVKAVLLNVWSHTSINRQSRLNFQLSG